MRLRIDLVVVQAVIGPPRGISDARKSRHNSYKHLGKLVDQVCHILQKEAARPELFDIVERRVKTSADLMTSPL